MRRVFFEGNSFGSDVVNESIVGAQPTFKCDGVGKITYVK